MRTEGEGRRREGGREKREDEMEGTHISARIVMSIYT